MALIRHSQGIGSYRRYRKRDASRALAAYNNPAGDAWTHRRLMTRMFLSLCDVQHGQCSGQSNLQVDIT